MNGGTVPRSPNVGERVGQALAPADPAEPSITNSEIANFWRSKKRVRRTPYKDRSAAPRGRRCFGRTKPRNYTGSGAR